MKNQRIALLGIAILISAIAFFALNGSRPVKDEEVTFEKVKEEESGADKQLTMWFQSKGYPDPYYLDDKYQRGWAQALKLKEAANSAYNRTTTAANWTSLGPSVDGNGKIGGRILCIAIDPSDNNKLWAGSASGGIWKSIDAGTTWTPVVTNKHILGVSAILIDPGNPNVIYAGTGEVYRVDTSNIGFNVWKTRGTYGIGILKSENGGSTWSQVLVRTSPQMFAIQAMAFDPTNSNIIYAAATDGLWRSGDNGVNWEKKLDKIYVKDVAINPSNAQEVVVSIGNMVNMDKGIYKTTNISNATPTWTKMTTGLPTSFEGSIVIDNVGSGEMMASIGISASTASSNREVYRSTDFGTTWTVVGGTTATTTTQHCSFQFWFAHTVAINPFHTDSILFAGVNWYRYRVSTTSRASVTMANVHGDVHDIVFDPVRRGRIYVCSDGGIFKSTNGGANWTAINEGLNATQFYASLGVSKTNMNKMIGGLQDNGQVLYNGTQWNQVNWAGGDGTSCAIDPNNDQNVLASRDARQVYKSSDGGVSGGAVTNYWGFVADSRTAFVAPLAFSKTSSDSVYLASDNLHISTNYGTTFTNNVHSTATNYIDVRNKTAIALEVSPINSQKVYVSTSPFAQADNDANNIIVTGTPNLLKTTTGNTPFTSIKGTLPDRFVMDIAISPTNDDSVFVAMGGFGSPHIYVTGDGGSTWTGLGGAILPDVPYNAILIDPVNPKIIYAGCDFGVYVSADRGQSWVDHNTGFWDATPVMDLQISADNKLIAATHGKGIFKGNLFSASTLPVRLIDFGGANQNTYNALHWTIAQEQDLSHYELERSTDGVSFQAIALRSSGNNQGQVTYTYNDPITQGISGYYYRLRIVNLDGTFTYSGVIFIKLITKTLITVINNPFRDFILLQYNLPAEQKIAVGLYNSSGALLSRKEYQLPAGTGVYSLYGFDKYPPGIYLLKIEGNTIPRIFKLMKN